MRTYRDPKHEIRSTKSETNPKFQTAILKRRGASFEMALPFCFFFLLAKMSNKAEPTRSSSRRASFVWNLLFESLPFVSDFVLWISDFAVTKDKYRY